MRDRLDTVERLLERQGITQADIKAFKLTPEQADQRGAWHQGYLARIPRIYQQEIEALNTSQEPTSEDVGQELARED